MKFSKTFYEERGYGNNPNITIITIEYSNNICVGATIEHICGGDIHEKEYLTGDDLREIFGK